MSQSRSSDITLVTAEGDTVTLSASQTMEMSFETYGSKGQSMGISKSSEFSLTVEGDLNREELKDIRKAIKTLLKAERDLLKGHEERATERTAKLEDLDQIASIDAKMEFRQTVSVTQTTAEAPAFEAQTSSEPVESETVAMTQPEAQTLPEATPQPATAPETPAPGAAQRFTVASIEKQQQFTFQFLWVGDRPVAVQGPGAPTLNGSQAVA